MTDAMEIKKSNGEITSSFINNTIAYLSRIEDGDQTEYDELHGSLLKPKFIEVINSLITAKEDQEDIAQSVDDAAAAMKPINEVEILELNGFPTILSAYDEAYVAELIALIDKLPQAHHLTNERINRWLSAILDFEPSRVKWHIKRLSGIGGSEMGILAAPLLDEHDPFNVPKDVFMDKMMIKIPEPPNGHMRRGTEMEDMICAKFRKKFKAKELSEALGFVRNFHDPDHPWLVGNPDDFVRIDGLNILVDYKCPMPGFKEKYDKYDVSFGYKVQLHHYATILNRLAEMYPEKADLFRVDGMLLVSWDYEGWDVDVRPVEMRDDYFEAVINGGDWIFDCILNNQMPVMDPPERITIEEDDVAGNKVIDLLNQSAKYNVLANQAYAVNETIKEQIQEILADRVLGKGVISHALLDVKEKSVVDEELLSEELVRLGYNLDDFKKPGAINSEELLKIAEEAEIDISAAREQVLDTDLALRAIEMDGVDKSKVEAREVSIKLSRSGHPEIKGNSEQLKAEAKLFAEQFYVENKEKFIPDFSKSDNKTDKKTSKSMKM